MELLTKKKKMRVCVGGAGTIPIYKDVQVLETYGRFVLAQHPDGQCGIYIDEKINDVLLGSRIFFGEIPGTFDHPGREIKVTNEPAARAKWGELVEKWQAREAEEQAQQAATLAMQKAKEKARQLRDGKVKYIVSEKNKSIDQLKILLKETPVNKLDSDKVTALVNQVQRCETILKYL